MTKDHFSDLLGPLAGRAPKIHYSGSLRIEYEVRGKPRVTLISAGFAACCSGKQTEKIRQEGNLSIVMAHVTCKRCRSLIAQARLCGKHLGDNDATCPRLTCIRVEGHEGLCDNVYGDLRGRRP